MKIIILLGLLGATMSAPLIPQGLLSSSNSKELLLNLNNAQLHPLQLQSPLNSWISPVSGILQQDTQIPGLSHLSLSTLEQYARLSPNQITFPGQVIFPQGNQVGQMDPSQPQILMQTLQGPSHAMGYVFSLQMPQEQAQMLQYYPVYMLLPGEQPQQVVTQLPPQTGLQKFEEQVRPGGQQQQGSNLSGGTAPKTVVMPAGGVIPYLQKEMINFRHTSGGIFTPSPSQTLSITNAFASAIGLTITPEVMEEKTKIATLKKP